MFALCLPFQKVFCLLFFRKVGACFSSEKEGVPPFPSKRRGDPVVGAVEDAGGAVGVPGDDRSRVLDRAGMADGAGDPDGEINGGGDGAAGKTDLPLVRKEPVVDERAGAAKLGAERVGKGLDAVKLPGDPPAGGDDEVAGGLRAADGSEREPGGDDL